MRLRVSKNYVLFIMLTAIRFKKPTIMQHAEEKKLINSLTSIDLTMKTAKRKLFLLYLILYVFLMGIFIYLRNN